ncbi:unnamed protein product [Urochloa humidicola]
MRMISIARRKISIIVQVRCEHMTQPLLLSKSLGQIRAKLGHPSSASRQRQGVKKAEIRAATARSAPFTTLLTTPEGMP